MRTVNAGTPQAAKSYPAAYTQFRGVDFGTDSTQVDASRSPGAKNMISDLRGYPEKRPGWRYLHIVPGNVNGIFHAVFEDGTSGLFLHRGTDLLKWDETDTQPETVLTGCLADARSFTWAHRGKVYVLDGEKYRVLSHDDDGYHVKNVEDDEPYIPTVRINVTGNEVVQIGNSNQFYGGHTYELNEEPNILTYKRKVTMCGDGASKKFYVGETDIDSIDTVTVAGAEVPAFVEGETQEQWYKVDTVTGLITFKSAPAIHEDGAGLTNIEVTYSKRPTERDEHKEKGTGTKKNFSIPEEAVGVSEVYIAGDKKKLTDDYTVNTETHTLTFVTAPKNNKEIRVVYTKRTLEKEKERINRCRFAASYGFYNDNRFFLSGDDERAFQNCDYMSGCDDPTYMPYDGFTRVGADTSKIVGYLKQYESLIIVKEDNDQDAQVFVRTAQTSGDEDVAMFTGKIFYPIRQGIRGVGAVGPHSMGVLRDDPLFLAEEGVFGIVSEMVKNEKSVQDRSFYVNKKLCAEKGLEKAEGVTWKGYFILSVNGHAYVADSRQQTAQTDTEYPGYEWYYWDNIPAAMWFAHDGALYFVKDESGTETLHPDGYRNVFEVPRFVKNAKLTVNGAETTAFELDAKNHIITTETVYGAADEVKLTWNGSAVCKMNTDTEQMIKFSDGGYPTIKRSEMTRDEETAYDSAMLESESAGTAYRKSIVRGKAIEAVWTTKADTFGTITNVKNVLKKGCAVMIRPHTRSSVEIGYLTNRDGQQSVKSVTADIFDFNDVDFERLTFNTLDLPKVIPINRKIKKFNILQIVLRNAELDEGFGIYGIQLTYTIGGFVK